jgi:lipoyl-dependent peroxiredoxin
LSHKAISQRRNTFDVTISKKQNMENNITISTIEKINQDIVAIYSNPVKIEKVYYTGRTHTNSGGRDGGTSKSDDGRIDLMFSSPGKKGNGTNPEQLFAAGWSACFIAAMKTAAGKMKITLPADLIVDTEVDLAASGDNYFLQARLNVSLPGLDRQIGKAVLEAAHQTCPYSRATVGNINVTITLV